MRTQTQVTPEQERGTASHRAVSARLPLSSTHSRGAANTRSTPGEVSRLRKREKRMQLGAVQKGRARNRQVYWQPRGLLRSEGWESLGDMAARSVGPRQPVLGLAAALGGRRRCAKQSIKKINLAAVAAACGWLEETRRRA